MREERYKKFLIEARAAERESDHAWNLELCIKNVDRVPLTITQFGFGQRVFSSEEEALEEGISCGRKVIDDGLSG